MKNVAKLMQLFSDETRLRLLMLLARRELCVCQLMSVLGVSQPLVSRNLSLMSGFGLLTERRDGKLVFYHLRKDLPQPAKRVITIVRGELRDDPVVTADLAGLEECREFQRRTGRCDLKSFRDFMDERRRRRKTR
jgi:ArsR family transcriptional regulator